MRERRENEPRGERMETREKQTRESRCVGVTNAGFETRVKARDEKKNTDAVISSVSC